ncbi:MAG TPA: STAS domain-containing protein [Candidatus Angelobacter sp.]|jgi:anti-sigma B factor antagonist|nr:STAS domain-containing protein [Candidatus Angelobacter sp.]
METNSRPVVVKRMPERVNGRTARDFLRDVRPFLTVDRPQIVFDLSQVRQLDSAGVEMLLRCMSEAHKRDGDVKLASLSDQSAIVLELTRTERLFEIYDTSTDAVRSFSGFLPNAMRQQLLHKRPIPIAA